MKVINHVYFEVKKFKDYGKLSNKNLDELIAGSQELKYLKIKKILPILFYGNHLLKMNLHGILHGEKVDQVGILNVQ